MTVNPVSGEAYIGDVGWNTWEEIDIGKGANFGWPCYEGGVLGGNEGGVTTSLQNGPFRTNASTSAACGALYAKGESAVKAPVYSYAHLGLGAAANAGAVYNGTSYPAKYKGALFIADYNKRWIKTLTFDSAGRATASTFGQDNGSTGPVQLLIGPDTNLYWLRYGSNGVGGEVRRIRYVGAGNTPPVPEVSATPMIGQAPLPVTFSSAGSHDPDAQPFAYSWNFGDGATSSDPNPTHTYTRSGIFTASLTLSETTAPFAKATEEIRITVGTNPPLATITAPPDGTAYAIGDRLKFTGKGSAAGRPIPATALSWEVRQGHNQHFHYFTPDSAASPTDPNVSEMTVIPDDHGDQTYYQVCLTATVSADVHDTNCIDLTPRKTTYTVATQPAGLTVQYEDEGLSLLGPSTIQPIVKSTQTLSVDTIQQHRSFTRWSDGVTAPSRTFVVGTTPATYTAVFDNKSPQARISATPLTGRAPLTVSANGGTSGDPEGDTLKYSWTDGQGGVSTLANPKFVYSSPGTYRVALTVTDQLGATNTASVNVVVTGTAANWSSVSIGAATNPGSTNFTTPTTVRISNAGPGITGASDAFRYVSQSRTGDFTFVARLDGMTNTSPYAKAGLMVREFFSPSSRHIMLAQTPTTADGTKLIARSVAGMPTQNVNWSRATLPPRWLKLVRTGTTFTGSQSANGTSWQVVGSTTMSLPATVHVGFAVGSQAPPSIMTAQFSSLSLS